jgi:adhesin/invasin
MRLRLAHAAGVLGILSIVVLPGLTVTGCNGGGGGTFVGGPVGVLPDATKSTVVLTTGASGVTADGIDTALVTVTLLDANGEPAPATVVTAAASPATGVTITQAGVSDVNGIMKVFITGSVVQSVVITATATVNSGTVNATSVVITQTATVDFVQPAPVLATGSTITVTPAPPGTVVADGTSTASIKVSLKSATGLPVPSAAVKFAATGTNNTLSAASGNTDASGNLTVTLASTKAEVKAITATITSGNIVLPTVNATFVAGPATGLTISAPTFTAGVPQTITVSIVDAKGNTVTSANNELALNLPTQSGAVYNHPISSGAPSFLRTFPAGNTITVAQGGVASFSGLVLKRAGNYTVGVVGAGFSAQTNITCVANTACRLIFAGFTSGTQDNLCNMPTTTNVGAPFNPVVKVLAVDIFFNPTTTLPPYLNVGNVSLAPSGTLVAGDLTGYSPQPLVNGVATFTGLAISSTAAVKDGCSFTASCAGGALPSAGTAPFSIRAAGAPVMIKVAVAGSPFISNVPAPAAFTVTAVDSAGTPQNAVTGITGTLYLVDSSTGGALSSLTANIAAGSNNVQIGYSPGLAGTIFTVKYTTTGDGVVPITEFVSTTTQTSTNGLPNAVTFTVNNGPPTNLAFANMDPGCGLPANTLVPNTGVTVNSPAGVISSPVPNIEVHARDAAGNLCMTPPNDYKGTVTLSMAGGTGTAALNPLNPTAVAVGGVAKFNALAFTSGATPAGTGYVITATGSGGLGPVALPAFNIIPAGNAPANAAKLVFLNSLTNTVAGDQILTTGQFAGSSPDDVIVQVQDFYGTPITTSYAFTATLDLLANTGVGSDKAGDTQFATFAGLTSPSCDVNGICHFQTNVSQSQACASYVLRATSGTLNPGCSNPIDILPGPAEIVHPPVLVLDLFTGGPPAFALHQVGNTAGFNNQPFPSVLTPTQGIGTGVPYLQVYDSQNNVATTFAGTCTAQIIIPNGGYGSVGGVLVGNTQVSFSSGNAIFTNLGIQNQGTATMVYSGLVFSIPGLPGYTNTIQSSFFTVHAP